MGHDGTIQLAGTYGSWGPHERPRYRVCRETPQSRPTSSASPCRSDTEHAHPHSGGAVLEEQAPCLGSKVNARAKQGSGCQKCADADRADRIKESRRIYEEKVRTRSRAAALVFEDLRDEDADRERDD